MIENYNQSLIEEILCSDEKADEIITELKDMINITELASDNEEYSNKDSNNGDSQLNN